MNICIFHVFYDLFVGDSEMFSKRGNTEEHHRRLKRDEQISKAYEANLDAILEVVEWTICYFRL